MNESNVVVASAAGMRPVLEHRVCLKILIADDSAAVRQYMKAKLVQLAGSTFDVEVDEAASGEEAVSSIEKHPYDLVILDVVMPGIGGHEACRRIKSIRKTRVAMLSSLKSGADHHQGRMAGCDNYLTKPPQDADMGAVLRIVYLRKSISP